MQLTQAQKEELRDLIASGRMIAAVKRYREITGVGLQEALHAVTQLGEAGGGETASGVSAKPDPKAMRQAEAEALAAIREGNVMEAIKRYRRHTKVGLKESKEAVDALTISHRSDGRVDPKLARVLMGMVKAGRKEEAVTHLMMSTGYDDAEARRFIKTVARFDLDGSGCARGCLLIILSVGLLTTLLIGLRQAGLL